MALLLVLGLLGVSAPATARGRLKSKPGSRTLFVVRTADGCALSTDLGRSESATSCRHSDAEEYTTALGTTPMEMTALDGVPVTLDVSQPARVHLVVTSQYLVGYVLQFGGGHAELYVHLTAKSGGKEVVIGEATDSYLVTPAGYDHEADLSIELDESLAGVELDEVTMHVSITGPTVFHGYVATDGASRVALPLAR